MEMNITLDEQKFQEYAEEQVRKSVDRYIQLHSYEIKDMIMAELTRIMSKHFSQIIESANDISSLVDKDYVTEKVTTAIKEEMLEAIADKFRADY
jgi:uncharacterized protein YejL (UPF0352 family)